MVGERQKEKKEKEESGGPQEEALSLFPAIFLSLSFSLVNTLAFFPSPETSVYSGVLTILHVLQTACSETYIYIVLYLLLFKVFYSEIGSLRLLFPYVSILIFMRLYTSSLNFSKNTFSSTTIIRHLVTVKVQVKFYVLSIAYGIMINFVAYIKLPTAYNLVKLAPLPSTTLKCCSLMQ